MSHRFEGRSLEEALQSAAETLGVERWQLTYHVLLEKRGFLTGEGGVTENNRRAKYYQLTALGRRQLQKEATTWRTYARAVFQVLDAEAL